MSTLSSVPRLSGRSLVLWPLFAACGVLIIAAILVPDLHRPKVVPSTPKAETKTTAKFAAPTQLEMGATTGRMALAAEPLGTSNRFLCHLRSQDRAYRIAAGIGEKPG